MYFLDQHSVQNLGGLNLQEVLIRPPDGHMWIPAISPSHPMWAAVSKEVTRLKVVLTKLVATGFHPSVGESGRNVLQVCRCKEGSAEGGRENGPKCFANEKGDADTF